MRNLFVSCDCLFDGLVGNLKKIKFFKGLYVNPLSADPTKWSNTFKIAGELFGCV